MTNPAATQTPTTTGTTALTSGEPPPAAAAAAPPATGAPPATDPAAPPAAADAAKADAAKAEADKKAADEAAKPLELKLPDGFDAKDPLLEQFKSTAKELGLKSEQAQKVFDLYAGAQQAQQAAYEQQTKQWAESLASDKEFGGKDFDANKGLAQKALIKFGSGELTQFLESSGLGNHPELVRAFYRVGKAISEDTVAGTVSGGAANPGNSDDALLRSMYPTMFPNAG